MSDEFVHLVESTTQTSTALLHVKLELTVMACGMHEEDVDLATERLPSQRSSSGLPSSSQSGCTGNSCGTCSSERGQAVPHQPRPKCLKCKDQLAVVRASAKSLAALNVPEGRGRLT